MNLVIHKGRMVADPEIKQFEDGSKVCNFRLAVRRDFKNREGEYESDFFNYTAGGPNADFIEKYGAKGRMCLVTGSLRSRKYTDRDGNNRTDIGVRVEKFEFEDRAEDSESNNVPAQESSASRSASGTSTPISGSDDDLPF